ncbi:golgin subfamily B member 1 isoform X2 [Etheostoma cragini]|uniref:golgin subfamily B member 1 isoform X2 n=1 Tax=Etheostoma cragini TaxID=417921 RepID=UPI00155E16C8|nr:golgin subfamily B member 1 isoform X2 [Etheostoma cragini]
MSELAGFNIEDMINFTPMNGGGGMLQEPKVEQLMGKLRRLQQVQTEAYQLEGIHKEKEELCRKLQFQCEESEQDSSRQLKQNKKSEEQLEEYRCEIQELKLKHRKQRMKFENQLHQLIEQHKNLHSVFTPERLPKEIESAGNTKSQLLSAEQIKLAQLHRLDEELEEMKKQKQPVTTAAETQEE